MWTMSAPTETWQVTPRPMRTALAGTDRWTFFGARSSSMRPSPRPKPASSPAAGCAPRRAPSAIPSPVSRAKPNVPAGSWVSTRSEVWPAVAISKSWIAPAELSATWVTRPRSMRSITRGASPTFRTWAPMAMTTGLPARRARTMRATRSLKWVPA